MSELLIIISVSWIAGGAAFVGGFIASVERTRESETKRELVGGVVAFGGGILIAAVAFALTPEGIRLLSTGVLSATFCAGGIVFCLVDAWLASKGGSRAQFLAMLMDFVPEALSLGAVFGENPRLGILLALFIGAQNLPEGFNSFRELVSAGAKPRPALCGLLAISLLGPIAGSAGYLFLQDHGSLTAGIMSFAGGGILYLIFQDIAPKSKMRRHWTPPLGAVLGFLVGMIGNQLIG